MPIQIMDNADPSNPPVDQTRSIVYVHVSVFVNNVDPTNRGLTGTTMDRSNWVAKAGDDYYGYFPASNAIDGNSGTYWIAGSVPNWLQVDMNNVNKVKGFTVVPAPYDDLKQIDVYSSMDGSSWKKEGTYNNAGQAGTSVIKTIQFVNAVTARYFKFNVVATAAGAYVDISELNGIQ